MIKDKLKEIYERQKMREKTMKWSPFFSHLLQSRAALLQAPDPQSKLKTMPLLEPDFFIAPYQASSHTTAAQNKVDQTPMPTPHPLPLAVSSPAQAEVSAPPPQTQNKPDEPEAPAQSSMANSQTESQPQAPSVTATSQAPAVQDGASTTSSAPNSNNPSVQPTKRFTLPLIRSKTGRIILPSSLKPSKLRPPAPRVSSIMCIIIFSQIYFLLFLTVGQGFYTLMVMNTKQKGEVGDTQPSDVERSSLLKSAHPSESGRVLEEDKTLRSSNPKLKRLAVKAPLAKLDLLNKSITGRPVAPKAAENCQEGGSVSCLSFNHGRQIPTAVEPDPSPGFVRRGRGRPRKNPITPVTPVPPVSEKEKPTVVEDSSKTRLSESETSILVEERQSKKIIVVVAKDAPAVVNDSPVPVKRGRGRPPKKKQEMWSPPATGAGSSPSKSEDSPMRPSRSFKSPDASPKKSPATASLQVNMKTSRPLTRGALGKDFPSAKKRSWIDVEKELDPELEYE